jgi:outer membrane protein assembly factor BamB
VVIAGRDQHLRVLDRKSGQERWSLHLGEGFVAGPVIVDGVVYLAGDANEGLHVFAVE